MPKRSNDHEEGYRVASLTTKGSSVIDRITGEVHLDRVSDPFDASVERRKRDWELVHAVGVNALGLTQSPNEGYL